METAKRPRREEKAEQGLHPRPSGSAPADCTWDESHGCWRDTGGEPRAKNQRVLNNAAHRRKPEAQARNRQKERERKERVRRANKLDEQEPSHNASTRYCDSQVGCKEESSEADQQGSERELERLRRGLYDPNNNLNKLCTQVFNFSLSDRDICSVRLRVLEKIKGLESEMAERWVNRMVVPRSMRHGALKRAARLACFC